MEAIDRFRNQIESVDLLGIKDKGSIDKAVHDNTVEPVPPYGEPYIAIRIKPKATVNLDDKRALHSKIVMNYMGKVEKRGE